MFAKKKDGAVRKNKRKQDKTRENKKKKGKAYPNVEYRKNVCSVI